MPDKDYTEENRAKMAPHIAYLRGWAQRNMAQAQPEPHWVNIMDPEVHEALERAVGDRWGFVVDNLTVHAATSAWVAADHLLRSKPDRDENGKPIPRRPNAAHAGEPGGSPWWHHGLWVLVLMGAYAALWFGLHLWWTR